MKEKEAATAVAELTLDKAWAEAEAALPRAVGWFDVFRRDVAFHDRPDTQYCAEAYTYRPSSEDPALPAIRDVAAFGPTPASALHELAVALRRAATDAAASASKE